MSVLNIEATDDPIVDDGTPDFSGGQFSNNRANLLKPNESSRLVNCDIGKLGKLTTRRGTSLLAPPSQIVTITGAGESAYNEAYTLYGLDGSGRPKWASGFSTYEIKWSNYFGAWAVGPFGFDTNNREGNYTSAIGAPRPWIGGPWSTVSGNGIAPAPTVATTATAGDGRYIQGLCNFQTPDFNYLVAVNAAKLYKYSAPNWLQICDGRVQDNDVVTVKRIGAINFAGGYPVPVTTIIVDGISGAVANNDTFTIAGEPGQPTHTISAHSETASNTTSITFAPAATLAPDNSVIRISKPGGQVNNGAGYAAAAVTIAVDGFAGAVANGDLFTIFGELGLPIHVVTAHTETGANTTSITFATAIASGGVTDNAAITIVRLGAVNLAGGYPVPILTVVVDGFVGAVANGDTFTIASEAGLPVHTVTGHSETAGNTTGITFAPALSGTASDDSVITLTKLGAINFAGGYPSGPTTILVDGFIGALSNGDTFTIQGEFGRPTHTVTGHAESAGNTTSVTFTAGIAAGFTGSDPNAIFQLAQGIDHLYFSDGIGNIFSWDGLHCVDLGNNQAGDISKPPKAPRSIVWFTDRLIAAGMPDEPDAVYFSDVLDGSTWDKNFQQRRVGAGDGDPITGLVPWTDFNLIVLRQHSIYVINCDPAQNTTGDVTQTVASFAVRPLHKHVGAPAPLTFVQTGGGGFNPAQSIYGSAASGSDVYGLTDTGVRSIRRTLAAETQQEVGEPLSFPVQDIIQRINPAAIHRSVATYRDSRYILAVPLDAATSPNFVLVHNELTQTWSGTWIGWFPTCFGLRVPDVHTGVGRLCIGQSDGTVLEWLDYVADQDEQVATFQDAGIDIPTSVLSRAYTFGDLRDPKTGLTSEFEFDKSTAAISIQTIAEAYSSASAFEGPFDTLSGTILTLPLTLPFTLPSAGILRRAFDLMRLGQFRELQFLIESDSGKLSMRSISLSAFQDAMVLQA